MHFVKKILYLYNFVQTAETINIMVATTLKVSEKKVDTNDTGNNVKARRLLYIAEIQPCSLTSKLTDHAVFKVQTSGRTP